MRPQNFVIKLNLDRNGIDDLGDFSYLIWGEGSDKPLLVFAHATGFNALTYRHLLAPLADRFRVIALDQRGHGMTSARADPELMRGWASYQDDMAAFLVPTEEAARETPKVDFGGEGK